MLKIKSEMGEVEYDYSGNVNAIFADLMCAINVLYEELSKEGMGQIFKSLIESSIEDGSAFTEDGLPEVKS